MLLGLVLTGTASAASEQPTTGAATPADRDPALATDPARVGNWTLFPVGDPFPEAVADPYRPRFAVHLGSWDELGVADTGDSRFVLELGGRFGLLRYGGTERPDRFWQLVVPAGFYGQFDLDNGTDNVGWDGIYGLIVERRTGGAFDFEAGFIHHSSHIGDELIERTGRERIDYTREEGMVGVHWRFASRWRSYLRGAYAWRNRNEELQEPWRAQGGLVFEAPGTLWGGRFGWFAAVDLSSFEERDWEVDTSVHVGLMTRRDVGTWRIGLDYHDGRPPIGELFQSTERWWSFGLRYVI